MTDSAERIVGQVARYRETDVVGDGVDQSGFKALLTLLESGRCWVKLSAPFRLGDGASPYVGVMPNMGVLLALVDEWGCEASIRDMIFSANPAQL